MQISEKLQQLAANLPEEYKENAESLLERMGEVIEGIGDRPIEWKPEILKVVQGSSDRSKLPKGTPIGALVVGEEILEAPAKIIPLRMWNTRQRWAPGKEARMECWSPDALTGYVGQDCRSCQYAVFDEVAKRSACNKAHTVLVISEDLKHLFQINFAKTAYSVGTDFAKLMKKAGVATFKRIYALDTQTHTKHSNVETMKLEPHGSTNRAVLDFLNELFKVTGEDRKIFLENFKEIVLHRRNDMAQLAAPEDGTGPVLIEADAETISEEQSEQAGKYIL